MTKQGVDDDAEYLLKRSNRRIARMPPRMLGPLTALLLCCSSMSFAQTDPPANDPDQDQTQVEPVTEEITVIGIAESLREAVKVKQEATAIVDAVAAKDVNKLPDKNLAEAVQ